jgi:hypothetical protein
MDLETRKNPERDSNQREESREKGNPSMPKLFG